MTLSFSGNSGI